MSLFYKKIDEDFYKSLSIDDSYSSIRISELPEAFVSAITEYNADIENNQSIIPRYYYATYMRDNNLFDIFPSVHNISYSVRNSSDFISSMEQKNSSTIDENFFSQTYPIAIRYTNGNNIWLIERPPFQANITYRANSSSSGIGALKTYSIWMPWTAMLINMNPKSSYYEAYLYFNDKPISSLDEVSVPCFFPNMYNDGRMCLNQTSIMLQQHLSEVNSFDINTVYNFIINDYMSGGWNLDLGIQNFDYIKSQGNLAHKAYNTIVHGIEGNKNYPSSLNSRSRYGSVSHKKYISNFLNYFSLAPSNEILEIIEDVKNITSLKSDNNYKRYSTYSENIKNLESYNDSNYDLFSQKFIDNPSVEYYYNALISPYLNISNLETEQIKILLANVTTAIDESLSSNLLKLKSLKKPTHYLDQAFQKENPMICIKDIDDVFVVSSEQQKNSSFYSSLIKHQKVS